MKKLTIITGPAGSGKTTEARRTQERRPGSVVVDEAERNWATVTICLEEGKEVIAVLSGEYDIRHLAM